MRHRNPASGPVDPHAATELELFISNDADLYRQQHIPIIKNLVTKMARGVYDNEKAVTLFMYLVDNGARKYLREFGTPGERIDSIFNRNTRLAVARSLRNQFLAEAQLGNYDHLLPKKYQKNPVSGAITPAKAKKVIQQEMSNLGLPPSRLTAKTIGFSDLARGERIFVTVHNWKPDPRAENLEKIARDHGFRVEFKGSGFIGNPLLVTNPRKRNSSIEPHHPGPSVPSWWKPKQKHQATSLADHWVVLRDGKTLGTFDTESQAAGFLLRYQGQSIQHAVQYEGYDIQHRIRGKTVYSYAQAWRRNPRENNPKKNPLSAEKIISHASASLAQGERALAAGQYHVAAQFIFGAMGKLHALTMKDYDRHPEAVDLLKKSDSLRVRYQRYLQEHLPNKNPYAQAWRRNPQKGKKYIPPWHGEYGTISYEKKRGGEMIPKSRSTEAQSILHPMKKKYMKKNNPINQREFKKIVGWVSGRLDIAERAINRGDFNQGYRISEALEALNFLQDVFRIRGTYKFEWNKLWERGQRLLEAQNERRRLNPKYTIGRGSTERRISPAKARRMMKNKRTRKKKKNPLLQTVGLVGNPAPKKPPFREGQKVPIKKALEWVNKNGSPALKKEFKKAMELQKKANRPAKYVKWKTFNFDGKKGIDGITALVHYGTTDETLYQPPRGSKKGKHLYSHRWGEGKKGGKPVDILVSADGKFMITPLGKGQKATDWMRG